MKTKGCSVCKEEKILTEFYKNNQKKSGLSSPCKDCVKEYNKNNKQKIKERKQRYAEKHKDTIKIKRRKRYLKNREKEIEYATNYWYTHKETLKPKRNKRQRERFKEDSMYKLQHNARVLTAQKLKRKTNSTCSILGCNWEELRTHLEDNPYGFYVGQDGMDLDHIIPISKATTEEEALKLSHYTNIQLLPSEYNRKYKSNRKWDREDFEEWLKNI